MMGFRSSLYIKVMCWIFLLVLLISGIFEINCSKDIKVQGIVGPCASLEKKSPLCSDAVIDQGGTSAWKMCGLDKSTSLCLFFDIVRKETPNATMQSTSNQFYFQILTYYQNNSGQMRFRVTTLSRRWVAGPGSIQDLISGFDQEVAAIVMARQVSFKMETEAFAQLLRAPHDDSDLIMKDRFPMPRLVVCDHNGSQVLDTDVCRELSHAYS
ncbi:protein transport protein SEC23 C-like isoform X2 [Vicia villosa]|uniref:protein transport protein SEC23 C-like isoform X2 n=1 Tax=Vicia villosa TaxID=3911 RepID=UPI00273C7179|nr:protein transport protein SEC23 C-like isoform X2 [Vicia villosa]